jgi:hypothetical protein
MFKNWLLHNEKLMIESKIIDFLKEKLSRKKYNLNTDKFIQDLYKRNLIGSPEEEREKLFRRIDLNISDLKEIVNKIAKFATEFGGEGEELKHSLLVDIDGLKLKIMSAFWNTYHLNNKKAS